MTDISFYPYAINGLRYPPSSVSMLPTSCQFFSLKRAPNDCSIFLRSGCFFRAARYALKHALEMSGVRSGDKVLLPSYHCRSLVEPVLAIGAVPVFYHLNSDLSINKPMLEDIIKRQATCIKTIVLTHYFGFFQVERELISLFEDSGIEIIEDCAHAFFNGSNATGPGVYGSYAIASPWKFFPVEHGGVLISRERKLAYKPEKLPVNKEIKIIAKIILRCFAAKTQLNKEKILDVDIPESLGVESAQDFDEFLHYDRGLANLGGSKALRAVISHSRISRIIGNRRNNYKIWLKGVEDIPGVQALYPELPKGVVPYIFPLLLQKREEAVFHELKSWGVPIWRWEDMANTTCGVASNYRLSLLQLPCHQDLSKDQIQWMINIIKLTCSD